MEQSLTGLDYKIQEMAGRIHELREISGFTYEQILADPRMSMLLPYLDVLVDGPFIQEQRDTHLLFRGSPNQRIIYLHGEPPEDIIPGTVPLEPLR